MLELCEKVIQGLEIGGLERHQFILEIVKSQVILLSMQGLQFVPNLFWSLQSRKMEKEIPGNREAQESKCFIRLVQEY